ncbi:MAG: hypothetical protein ACOYMB_00335 [Patescibacteria group bacterium]
MKKLTVTLTVLIFILTAVSCGKSEIKIAQKKNAELESRNLELNELLITKAESLCDTTTINQKLKLQKIHTYELDCYQRVDQIIQSLIDKKYLLKEEAGHRKQIINEEADEDANVKVIAALKQLEKSDPEGFQKIAATSLYRKYDCIMFTEEIRTLEKRPAVKIFLNTEEKAKNICAKTKEDAQRKYENTINAIDQEHQNNVKIIEFQCKKEIDQRKKELGL